MDKKIDEFGSAGAGDAILHTSISTVPFPEMMQPLSSLPHLAHQPLFSLPHLYAYCIYRMLFTARDPIYMWLHRYNSHQIATVAKRMLVPGGLSKLLQCVTSRRSANTVFKRNKEPPFSRLLCIHESGA